MRRDRGPEVSQPPPPEVVSESTTLVDLHQAIINCIIAKFNLDSSRVSEIEKHLRTPELEIVDDVWWLLSLEAVRVILQQNEISLVSAVENQELSITLTKKQRHQLEKFLDKTVPIAIYGFYKVYLHTDALSGTLKLDVREERTISGDFMEPNIKLILDAATPVLEADSHGKRIIAAELNESDGVVTYYYEQGEPWSVDASDPYYATHQQIAEGKSVKIGEELKVPVLCRQHTTKISSAMNFFDANTGRPVNYEQIHAQSADSQEAISLINNSQSCVYIGDDSKEKIAGQLHLMSEDGAVRVIDSVADVQLYLNLVHYYFDKSTFTVGRVGDGSSLYFNARSGAIVGKLDRETQVIHPALRSSKLLLTILPGHYYNRDEASIWTYAGGRALVIEDTNEYYPILSRLIKGHIGIIPYYAKTGTGKTEIRVYTIKQSDQGIVIDDLPTKVDSKGLEIVWYQHDQPIERQPEQATLFTIPQQFVEKDFPYGLAIRGIKSVRTQSTSEKDVSAAKTNATKKRHMGHELSARLRDTAPDHHDQPRKRATKIANRRKEQADNRSKRNGKK